MLLSQVIYPRVCIMSAECVPALACVCLSHQGGGEHNILWPLCQIVFLLFLVSCKQRWVNMLFEDSFM